MCVRSAGDLLIATPIEETDGFRCQQNTNGFWYINERCKKRYQVLI